MSKDFGGFRLVENSVIGKFLFVVYSNFFGIRFLGGFDNVCGIIFVFLVSCVGEINIIIEYVLIKYLFYVKNC